MNVAEPARSTWRLRAEIVHRAWRYRLKLDPDEIAWMRGVLRPGDVVVDAGAHKGGYSYWMRKAVGPAGLVFAFEPQPALAKMMQRTVEALGWDNVRVENMGLSSEAGEATLHVPAGGPSPGATLVAEAAEDGAETLRVPVDSLDHYLERAADRGRTQEAPDATVKFRTRVRFIKCDVEGHELSVFRGARRILETDRPLLLFECEARHNPERSIFDVFSFLESIGYAGHFFLNGRLVGIAAFSPDVHQLHGQSPYVHNFVFVPEAFPAP